MYKTILRIMWPYILRYLANRSTEYLDHRREQRRQHNQAAAETELAEYHPAQFSQADAVWYTLGGVLLGSALGLILAIMLREES
jgi:hypothetical protein